jgi:hypothetical protein
MSEGVAASGASAAADPDPDPDPGADADAGAGAGAGAGADAGAGAVRGETSVATTGRGIGSLFAHAALARKASAANGTSL